eukprot:GHVU01109209.1.p1 GENE.GHVU01109209.1~~GHVU01109209.1.p1  ORF type:complete len:119 (-),score=9.93 GHVU01109209.1:27-383(-)
MTALKSAQHESGENAALVFECAQALYAAANKTKIFSFLHCLRELKASQKFKTQYGPKQPKTVVGRKKRATNPAPTVQESSLSDVEADPDADDRPTGKCTYRTTHSLTLLTDPYPDSRS